MPPGCEIHDIRVVAHGVEHGVWDAVQRIEITIPPIYQSPSKTRFSNIQIMRKYHVHSYPTLENTVGQDAIVTQSKK